MISSHADIRNQICRDILPMAYQSESLLYATMAFSALHRSTLLNELPDQFVPEDLVSELILASMYCLRRDLETPGHPTQPLLHTIRTLCHCEIYSGRANSSWRVHVKGAGAMFSAVASRRDLDHSEYSFWLWSRWFWSIQALTAVTDVGTLSELSLEVPAMQENHEDYFFDTYTGYSSDLNIVLVQIGAMAQKKQSIIPAGVKPRRARRFIIWRRHASLRFPSHVVLDKNTVRQFEACNTAYQNAGLIHLYRRLRNMPTVSEEVQGCVRTILDAVYAILPITTLSPWILLTTPIYTAGCEAVGQDRDLVKDLLLGLYSTLRIRNILRAIEILNHNWRVTDKFRNIQQRISGKDSRKRICDVTGTLDFLDFIPY
ncbi:hypothetical protein N7462_002137 [Penicillium macrosclerotiorum]|uniref:uncharacterized protein n=1 Tax=Penicillium macrosclerotiorum TaxID=303699 RepID=UPI0025467F43|nr:uncharacterized protein N7462_002137 [Penicillium macrosclerotiorum]KAJ5692714.1 hypothetical protein N7462_002137 [Penicillium macrosclerotiorum]